LDAVVDRVQQLSVLSQPHLRVLLPVRLLPVELQVSPVLHQIVHEPAVELGCLVVLLLDVPKHELDVRRSAMSSQWLFTHTEVVAHIYSEINESLALENALERREDNLEHELLRPLFILSW